MEMKKKAQTSTEYLIILAVVIVIALIVVSVLGGIPSIGGGMNEQTAKMNLASAKVAVVNYAVSDYDTKLKVQNNNPFTIKVNSISIGGSDCNSINSFVLSPGSSKTVTCTEAYEATSSKADLAISIDWTDMSIDADYIQESDDLALVGSVSSKYMSILQANTYWDDAIDGCWDASQPTKPICTCVDLAKVDTDGTTLAYSYALQNNIDFNRCKEEFGADYVTGSGWDPISTFTGSFDGQGNLIKSLYIDNNVCQIGLFGVLNGGDVLNLDVVNSDISGICEVGIIAGRMWGPSVIEKSFSSGNVVGTSSVGGVLGYNDGGNISNSYSHATITGGSGGFAGGLVGGNGANSIIEYSYATGTVTSEGDNVGGLTGYNYDSASIDNSFSTGGVIASGAGRGGLVGYNYLDATVTNSYWYNFADNPSTCIGDDDGGAVTCTASTNLNDFYSTIPFTNLGWDTSIWKNNGNSLPTLR